jgi:hypothetical protein
MAKKYVLMFPHDWFLIYFIAAIPTVMLLVLGLRPARNAPMIAFVGAVMLPIGWWRALFWNPIVSIDIERGVIRLIYRRGSAVTLDRNELLAVEEYRFGQRKQFIGLRFRTRDGRERTTTMIPDVVRDNVSRHIANELHLTPVNQADGYARWSV